MKRNKAITGVLKGDFAGWLHNYKIYIVLIMLTIFVLDNYTSSITFAKAVGYRVTPYMFPLLWTHPFMHFVVPTCVIFLFSNAPFINNMQLLLMSRTGKRKWYGAQMFYIMICSLLLTIFLAVLPIIRNINMIVFKAEWGKVWSTIAGTFDFINPVEYTIVSRYSANTAMIYSLIIFTLTSFLLGMILLFCNSVFRIQGIGTIITVFLVGLDFFFHLSSLKFILWISPISWLKISNLAYARDISVPSIKYAIIALLLMNLVLVLATFLLTKRKDITVIVEEA